MKSSCIFGRPIIDSCRMARARAHSCRFHRIAERVETDSFREETMTMLTSEQHQAVEQADDQPVPIVDPQTRDTYYLLRSYLFQKMSELLEDEGQRAAIAKQAKNNAAARMNALGAGLPTTAVNIFGICNSPGNQGFGGIRERDPLGASPFGLDPSHPRFCRQSPRVAGVKPALPALPPGVPWRRRCSQQWSPDPRRNLDRRSPGGRGDGRPAVGWVARSGDLATTWGGTPTRTRDPSARPGVARVEPEGRCPQARNLATTYL